MSARTCDECGGTGRRAARGTFVKCDACFGHGTLFDPGVTSEEVVAAGYDPRVADTIAAKWPRGEGSQGAQGGDDPPPGPGGGVPKGN